MINKEKLNTEKQSRTVKFFLGLLFITAISACSESFTDLSPISQRNVNTFYNTESDLTTAVNAAYKALQMNGLYNQSYWVMFEMRSDNTDAGADITGLGADLAVIDNFVEVAQTAEIVNNAYLHTYVGIGRCNIVLDRIDAVSMDENRKNRMKGEVLFLRSLYYYHLAVAFGNIPMPLTSLSVDEGRDYLQLPAAQIYEQLVADLTLAEQYLGHKGEYAAADVGRATKGAAAALLGKVYLTIGNRDAAVPVLRRVIADYGYTLLDNYTDLWGIPNKNNAESIFEVQYRGGGFGTGNAFTNAFSPLLVQSTGAYKNRPTSDLLSSFEEGDARLEGSLRTSYVSNTTGQTINAAFSTKFGTSTQFTEVDADYNFMVLRYADVLLMLAEALGESTEAYALINQVRQRANLNPIDATTPGTFEDKLLHERQVELAFENHRWADLLRFGKAQEVMQAHGKSPRLLFLIPQRELDLNTGFVQNNY